MAESDSRFMNRPLVMPVCVKAYVIICVAVQHKNRIPEDRGKNEDPDDEERASAKQSEGK